MVEVGIPVWHARDTLCKCLDSLVAQTLDKFITCLSIDCDGEDYSDIIETYRARGLKIRVINGEENGGPGAARQRIIDTTQCDYLIFMDADDMLMPRAVEVLSQYMRVNNFDIMRSGFIREEKNKQDLFIPQDSSIITWFHGKIYRVKFLKEKNIRFLPGLRIDEDAYFNLIAWNSTDNRGEIAEYTYIWRDNKNSLTRAQSNSEYFKDNYMNYIISQVRALQRLLEINESVKNDIISITLINIYYTYMRAAYLEYPMAAADELISELKAEKWLKNFLNDADSWISLVNNVKAGEVYNNEHVIFYDEPINHWIVRLLVNDRT